MTHLHNLYCCNYTCTSQVSRHIYHRDDKEVQRSCSMANHIRLRWTHNVHQSNLHSHQHSHYNTTIKHYRTYYCFNQMSLTISLSPACHATTHQLDLLLHCCHFPDWKTGICLRPVQLICQWTSLYSCSTPSASCSPKSLHINKFLEETVKAGPVAVMFVSWCH